MKSEAARPFWYLAAGFGLLALGLYALGFPNPLSPLSGSVVMLMAGTVQRLT